MSRHEIDSIMNVLESVWRRHENLVRDFFKENPDAVKMRRTGVLGGSELPCSVIKDSSNRLYLLSNHHMSPVFRGRIGKAKYALDVTREPHELCIIKVVKNPSGAAGMGHDFTEEHRISQRIGVARTNELITRNAEHAGSTKQYYAMQYLGESLDSLLKKYMNNRTPENYQERILIAQLVLKAIKAFRDQGLCHGDIHKGNITIERDAQGRAVRAHLIDFGRTTEAPASHDPLDYQVIACDIFPIYYDPRSPFDDEWCSLLTKEETKLFFSRLLENHPDDAVKTQITKLCNEYLLSAHMSDEDPIFLSSVVAAAIQLRDADLSAPIATEILSQEGGAAAAASASTQPLASGRAAQLALIDNEVGFPIEDNSVVAIRSHDDGSFDVVGSNNAKEKRFLRITPNGVFENHYDDKKLGLVHRQMANHLNKIFDHFHVDRTPEQKVVFAAREAVADYETIIASKTRFSMWHSSDKSQQIIDELKRILEGSANLSQKAADIRDLISQPGLLERNITDRLPNSLVQAGLLKIENKKLAPGLLLEPLLTARGTPGGRL